MKTSVLMSVYRNDDPGFLKTALESIYEQQTLKPNEIVIVFDGALTDELYAVLYDFRKGKEAVVNFYPLETNMGLGNALRIGAQKCTGDYIFRMDSDDISLPNRFQKQIEYMNNNPNIDVLGSNIGEFFDTPDAGTRIRVCPSEHSDIVNMAKKRCPMNHVSVCIKRSALETCGGYESLLLLEDYYLWLKMIVSGCVLANIDDVLVFVRIGNGFHKKRGSRDRIRGWKKLQVFMVENRLIGHITAMVNMIYIVCFVYCPSSIKKLIYDKFLRN